MLALHNQLPALYCNNTCDPGLDRYPDDQVDRCPEGAGGGNVRLYVCGEGGRVRSLTLGYWRKDVFLRELREGQDADEVSLRLCVQIHRDRRDRETRPIDIARQNLLIRGHEEALADFGRPVAEVLARIEEEIYTKGKIG